MSELYAAVVGVGNMGRNHARVLASMEDVRLVGVVDRDYDVAERVAGQYGTSAFTDLDDLPDLDFAVVAVPTVDHMKCAEDLISRGVSVLVEKPLASTPDQANHLVSLAVAQGVLLATGHIERFNPVIFALAGMVTEPLLMQFSRLSPYTPRIRESIVFDLMVHDLDLACLIAGELPVLVSAGGVKVLSDTLDAASAILTFPRGCVASVTASRITQDKVRKISVSEEQRFFEVDCLRQELSVKRETTAEYKAGTGYRQASVMEIPYLDRRAEPLALELKNFIDALRGEAELVVDGRAGAAAVALACGVEEAIEGRNDTRNPSRTR